MPVILAQNELLREAAVGLFAACSLDTGGFKFIPWALAERRPASFKPPLGFFPSDRVHAGDLAIFNPNMNAGARRPPLLATKPGRG